MATVVPSRTEDPHWSAGYRSVLEWAQLPTSRDQSLLRAMYGDHKAARDRHEPGSADWMREAGMMEGFARVFRELTGRAMDGAEAERGENPAGPGGALRDTQLSESLKRGEPLGGTEHWKSCADAVKAARDAAVKDLRAKSILYPSQREIDVHAAAKLQARVNINAKKYGNKPPPWLVLMKGGLQELRDAIKRHAAVPRGDKPGKNLDPTFPTHRRWKTGLAALNAAKRATSKRYAVGGGKWQTATRAEREAEAAKLLGVLVAKHPQDADTAWHKSAMIALHELQGRVAAREAKRKQRKRAEPRKNNPSPARVEQLAEEFVNGGAPADERLPLTRKQAEIVLFPAEGYDVGILLAFEYLKPRPGVDGKFFIHRLERKDRPVVFMEKEGTIELTPSAERWANRRGATKAATVEVVGPAVKTGIRQDDHELADGGTVTKLWITLPTGTVDVRGKRLPFNVWELTFPATSRPTLDFTDGMVTMNFTRGQWSALPESQRVFWQYVGRKPTTREGHGF